MSNPLDQVDILQRMIDEVEDYAIIVMDGEGIIKNWNKGAQKIKGYSSEDIVGKNFRCFYTEEDRLNGKPDRLINEALQFNHAQDEGWRVRKDGSKFWANVTITAIHNEENDVIGFSKLTRDLTERRKSELRLAEHARNLEEKNLELEQLTYIVSHDLKSPLNGITRMLGMLKSRIPKEYSDSEEWQMLQMSAGRMREVIEDVLEYSLIGKNQKVSSVDLSLLIKDVITDISDEIESTQAFLETPDNLPVLKGYPTPLRLLFQNLFGNAIKFRKVNETPKIKLAFDDLNDHYQFTISDNGIGIDKAYYGKIFKAFQRLHSKREYPGSGIGLANCIKVVELHHGRIWVESEPGEGSDFHFTLTKNLK